MKAILLVLLVAMAFSNMAIIPGTNTLLASGLTSSTLIGSSKSISAQYYHNTNNAGFISGSGAIWIYDNAGTGANSDSWPANYAATFQSLFYADCTAPALLSVTADNIFAAYINGVNAGTGNNWQQLYTFTITLKCGLNNLTIVARNENDVGPAAVIFAVQQDTSACYVCSQNAGAFYNRDSCKCQCSSTCFCSSRLQTWNDYPACACTCSQILACVPPKYFNQQTCSCQCPKKWCPRGQNQDPNSCACASGRFGPQN